jgi:hypothetical protein
MKALFQSRVWFVLGASIAACVASIALLLILDKATLADVTDLQPLSWILSALFMPYWGAIALAFAFEDDGAFACEGNVAQNGWRAWGAWLCAALPVALYFFMLVSEGDPGGWGFFALWMFGPIISPFLAGFGALAGDLLFRLRRAITKARDAKSVSDRARSVTDFMTSQRDIPRRQ